MSSLMKRRQGSEDSSSPDLVTQGKENNTALDQLSHKQKKRLERFLQYLLPPVLFGAVTVGIFLPSYKSDPVSLQTQAKNIIYKANEK